MTNQEAAQLNGIRASAESKLDNIESQLNRLDAINREARSEAVRNINNWQSWLGAVSFSLAAISGVTLNLGESSLYAICATTIFLIIGLWIVLTLKNRFEVELVNSQQESGKHRSLLEKQKEHAWRIYQNPEVYEEVKPLLTQSIIDSMTNALDEINDMISAAKKAQVSYVADIQIVLLISGVFLLIADAALEILLNLNLAIASAGAILIGAWVVTILLIIFGTVSSVSQIEIANKIAIEKLDAQRASVEDYIDALKKSV